MELNLNWIQCQGDAWCKLSTVNLEHVHFNNLRGVYVIWHGGQQPATVWVGGGVIRDGIRLQRTNPAVQQFSTLGLFVTWASVPDAQRPGVLAYLTDLLKPKAVSDESRGSAGYTMIIANPPWK